MDDFEDFALTNEMLEKVLGGANMNGNIKKIIFNGDNLAEQIRRQSDSCRCSCNRYNGSGAGAGS
jgi:hypothetical protein